MTVMEAKFDSKCYSDASFSELCDGITAGDEIIYKVIRPARMAFNGQTIRPTTSVGHLTCRTAEFESDWVAMFVKIAKGQQDISGASDEAIEKAAENMRDWWLAKQARR